MNTKGEGKYLLQKRFDRDGYFSDAILWLGKAAFLDAVGHTSVDFFKIFAEELYGDDREKLAGKSSHGTPFTKESLLYLEIFKE